MACPQQDAALKLPQGRRDCGEGDRFTEEALEIVTNRDAVGVAVEPNDREEHRDFHVGE